MLHEGGGGVTLCYSTLHKGGGGVTLCYIREEGELHYVT